jgi:hypothetical protein
MAQRNDSPAAGWVSCSPRPNHDDTDEGEADQTLPFYQDTIDLQLNL